MVISEHLSLQTPLPLLLCLFLGLASLATINLALSQYLGCPACHRIALDPPIWGIAATQHQRLAEVKRSIRSFRGTRGRPNSAFPVSSWLCTQAEGHYCRGKVQN